MSRRQLATVAACVALCVALFAWFAVKTPVPQAPPSSTVPAFVTGSPSSTELIEHPKEWDGKRIAFTGEAVSCRMVRGRWAWIHLNDDSYSRHSVEAGGPLTGYNAGQAVWLPASPTAAITTFGGYNAQGDIVRVEGVFHAACAQHGGDMDIHADVFAVQSPGKPISHRLPLERILALFVLAPLAGFLWWLHDTASWRERTTT